MSCGPRLIGDEWFRRRNKLNFSEWSFYDTPVSPSYAGLVYASRFRQQVVSLDQGIVLHGGGCRCRRRRRGRRPGSRVIGREEAIGLQAVAMVCRLTGDEGSDGGGTARVAGPVVDTRGVASAVVPGTRGGKGQGGWSRGRRVLSQDRHLAPSYAGRLLVDVGHLVQRTRTRMTARLTQGVDAPSLLHLIQGTLEGANRTQLSCRMRSSGCRCFWVIGRSVCEFE